MPYCIRMVVIDSQPLFVRGLVDALNGGTDIKVVGTAQDSATGMTLCLQSHPDVILLALDLCDADGLTFLQSILHKEPRAHVAILAIEDSPLIAKDALAAGARGYMVKTSNASRVRQMVLEVGCGRVWVDPVVLAKAPLLKTSPRDRKSNRGELTSREREVARLTLKHHGNVSKVATELYSSQSVVRYHLSNIYRKLGCQGIGDLVLQLSQSRWDFAPTRSPPPTTQNASSRNEPDSLT